MLHLFGILNAPRGQAPNAEDAMSNASYVADTRTKISLHPPRQAIKRAALAVALALGVAGAADFGHYYLTTGR
jgi:membrane fusion protein (multidrug efflux system)